MDTKQMEYFIALAEEMSITQAAQKLYLSQPALTIFLSNLEKNMGTKLFTRVHNKLQLTYPGKLYLDCCRRMLSIHREMTNAIGDYNGCKAGELRISTTQGRAEKALPYVYPRFREAYPHINFILTEDTAQGCLHRLVNGTVDLAFLAFSNESFPAADINRCKHIPLFRDEPIIVTWRGNPVNKYAKRVLHKPFPILDLQYLKDSPFILLPPGSHTSHVTTQLFNSEKISPEVILYLQNFSAIYSLLQSCHASTISTLVHYRPNENLDYYSLENVPYWNLSAIYRKDFALTRYHNYCIELMQKDFEQIQNQIDAW